jgi:hypothetical protein
MLDLLFIAIVIAFFGLAALFVRFCDSVVGPDEAALAQTDDVEVADEVVA